MNHDHLNAVHQDVTSLLEDVVGTVERSSAIGLVWSQDTARHRGPVTGLRRELRSVRDLELRMPIVAPMKAGKSTIINAIVGYDLLPARTEAMTTLPTRIELVDDLTEPELLVHPDDVATLGRVATSLRGPLHAERESLVQQYDHLRNLIDVLGAGRLEGLRERYVGHREVLRVLTLLNDLVRLASRCLTDSDVVGELTDAPTLRTPYWRRPELASGPAAGRLSIIDTPGPDEGGFGMRLTRAVESQLANSHIVLIVLDYTAMGRVADDEIRDLTDPVVAQIGRHKLYAVVNKVDQRRPGSQDESGVRNFVQVALDLVDASEENRVFETKGRLALSSAKVLAALERDGDRLDLRTDPAVRAFLREQYEDDEDLRDALENWTHQMLAARATRKWRESGVPQVLQDVVNRLRGQAVPMLLESSLDRLGSQLRQLDEKVQVRVAATTQQEESVRRELEALAEERNELGRQLECTRRAATQVSSRIDGQLHAELARVEDAGREILAGLRGESDGSPLRRRMRTLNVFASGRNRSDGSREFGTEAEAHRYTDELVAAALPSLRAELDRGRSRLTGAFEKIVHQEVRRQEAAARPIIRRATERLSRTFSVDLALPDLDIHVGDVTVGQILPDSDSREVTRTRDVTRRTRTWRHWLWLVPRSVTTTEEYVASEEIYRVDHHRVHDSLLDSYLGQVKRVRAAMREFVDEELNDRLEVYHEELDRYLRGYADELASALETRTAGVEEQRCEVERFEAVRKDVAGHLDRVEDFRRQLAQVRDLAPAGSRPDGPPVPPGGGRPAAAPSRA